MYFPSARKEPEKETVENVQTVPYFLNGDDFTRTVFLLQLQVIPCQQTEQPATAGTCTIDLENSRQMVNRATKQAAVV